MRALGLRISRLVEELVVDAATAVEAFQLQHLGAQLSDSGLSTTVNICMQIYMYI